jgi:histidinol-phosphate aminotransferase
MSPGSATRWAGGRSTSCGTTGSNNVNAAAAGIATLPDRQRVAREVKLNAEAREFTTKAFADMGYPSASSQANFVMVNIRRDVKAFQDGCRQQNVLVGRTVPPLTTYARVSIGTMDEMRQAVEVFKRVLGTTTTVQG